LAGANLIYGLGMLDNGMTFSFPQLIIDNEFAKMIKQVCMGIPVNDETLAVDEIHEVGPAGEFLTRDDTAMLFKELRSIPKFIDRNPRSSWEEAGCPDILKRAEEEARHILENYKPDPLPKTTREEIRTIVDEAEKELGVSWEKTKMIETA
jgi:trimethylamine--corrinoid protein Co-methyltransferase